MDNNQQNVPQTKHKPKNPIKFQITLNEEQKQAKSVILSNKITILKGMAGSGKTLLACQIGLDMLFRKDIEKIIIARPMVNAGEDMGFLPGGVAEKTREYLIPIYDNMYQLYNKNKIDELIADNKIEICPLGMLRGRTFTNALVIIDESQNLLHSQTEGMLSRLGKGSKMIVCGDQTQCDLKDKKQSGFPFLKKLENLPGFAMFTLKQNHRDEIVELILQVYSEYRD
jgi:phosphate starvation-inducible PhoH-like protein